MPDLVLWHGADKRLQSQQQVEAGRDQSYSYLAEYRVKEKKFIRLADDELRTVLVAPKGRWAVGYDNRDYELDANLDGRSYRDVSVIDMTTGARKPALKKSRYSFSISHRRQPPPLLRRRRVLHLRIRHRQVLPHHQGRAGRFRQRGQRHQRQEPAGLPHRLVRGRQVRLLSDGWDIWNVGVHGGGAVNITVNGRKDQIRYSGIFQHDRDLKGIDPSKPMYIPMYGEWTKKAGIGRIEKGKPGLAVLLWDDAGFGGPLKAENAEVYSTPGTPTRTRRRSTRRTRRSRTAGS